MNNGTQKKVERQSDETALLTAKISELTEANQALAGSQILVTAILESIPDRIYVKDTQSRFLKISKALATRFGLNDPKDAIGKTDFDFQTQERAREFFDDEQKIINTGQPLINKIEKQIMANGETAWTSTTKVPLRDRNGVIIGIVGINRDVTDLKKAEMKVESINRELSEVSRQAGMAEVATGVLHNVGNVLNSVNVAAGVLADRLNHSKANGVGKLSKLLSEKQDDLGEFFSADERGRQIPAYLQQLADHINSEQADMRKELSELVLNVEHIKEIVAMQQSYARVMGVAEVVKLADVMEDAIKMQGGAYERHGINLIRDYVSTPPVAMDKHKVMQILVNFLSNAKYACDASEKELKKVTVRTRQAGKDRVRLEVEDNGIGINPENLGRIFSQGFTTRKNGHGFGLHSGRNAAKELGGELHVTSDGVGKGAIFTLELPLVAPTEQAKT